MKNHKRNKGLAVLALVAIMLATMTCNLRAPIVGISGTATPLPGQPGKPGDYGDAPDGDHGMDTGYYAPTGGPWMFTYESAGIAGNFPTMGEDPVPGPFMIDVDEFWIGPLFGASNLADVPSIEDDADDPQDPDGVANLQTPGGRADCDKENGSHNPAGNNCMPVPAWSIPMNARLSIFFGYPPLGVWFTAVNASENMTYEGPVYWNLLVDLNQNGEWDGGEEWVVRDKAITLTPGEHETLISPAFKVPSSGRPFGRINFPFWVRSMVSSESVKDKVGSGNWDGRGTDDGFEIGEVEDYFVEWRPIGQILPNPPQPIQANACGPNSGEMLEHLSTDRDLSDEAVLMPGENVESMEVIGVGDTDTGGIGITGDNIDLSPGSSGEVTYGKNVYKVSVDEEGRVHVIPTKIEEDINLDFIPKLKQQNECSGSAPVEVTSGVSVPFAQTTGETVVHVWGWFGVHLTVVYDKAGHITFIGMPEDLLINILGGSISIEGPHPWVNVSGDYDEDSGAFSASGTGTVAGFPGIAVTFEGTLDENGVSGEYTMGANGGLPSNEPIRYSVEGQRLSDQDAGDTPAAETGPAGLAPGVADTIQSFVDVFNAAFADGNTEHLYQLLHPTVIDMYGEEACRVYLGTIVETPTTLEYLDATRIGAWDFERDGAVIPADFAYAVQANFTADEQTTQQELHLTLPGDDSVRWFTDCGEPMP